MNFNTMENFFGKHWLDNQIFVHWEIHLCLPFVILINGVVKRVLCALSASVHEGLKSPYHSIDVQASDNCLFVALTHPCASLSSEPLKDTKTDLILGALKRGLVVYLWSTYRTLRNAYVFHNSYLYMLLQIYCKYFIQMIRSKMYLENSY